MEPGSQRDRLAPDLYLGEGHEDHALKDLERAFDLLAGIAPIEKKLRDANMREVERAVETGLISADEHRRLVEAREAVARVVAVDAFPMDEISPLADQHRPGERKELPREAAE